MRKRFNVIAVAIVLAIGSFAYARYRYIDRHSVDVANTKITFAGQDLFGDWMKDELIFAIVVPVAVIAAGCGLALKRKG
jgi:hypothetical protein